MSTIFHDAPKKVHSNTTTKMASLLAILFTCFKSFKVFGFLKNWAIIIGIRAHPALMSKSYPSAVLVKALQSGRAKVKLACSRRLAAASFHLNFAIFRKV